MSKCPVCKGSTGFYEWPSIHNPDKPDIEAYPLYQQSYPGAPRYISERCSKCFDKAIKKESRRGSQKNSGKSFQKTVPAVPAPACMSCRAPLGINTELSDYGQLTELILRSCANCLTSVKEAIEKRLDCEPDYANAIVGPGYEIGINFPKILLIPMKKRPGKSSFWSNIFRR